MQITLPPVIQALIEDELASGRFESPEEVVIEAIRHLHDASMPHVPDEWLVEARAQVDRGETRPFTEEVWSDIIARAHDDSNDEPIPDEVKY